MEKESLQTVLEEVVFILNELRNEKLKALEKTKLSDGQEEILERIDRDLKACLTKLGLVLHPTEL
ncbi:MAG TPA: hypothetical protein VFE88_01265 [Candidatus Nanoarchaeia archaeon]|nr:hypothetical protein [Candidatus Nanoarchaeia archaeon]